MRKNIFFVVGILVLGLSCGRKTGDAKVDKPRVVEEVVVVEEQEIEEEVEEEVEEVVEAVYLLCEFRRSACYGKCPSFVVKLYSDGKVSYEGKANVERIGRYESYCSALEFEAIFTAADAANYFVLRSQYPVDGQTLSDLPNTITYLKRNGLEKRIIDNFDAPKELVDFENWLEVFFNDLKWEQVKD